MAEEGGEAILFASQSMEVAWLERAVGFIGESVLNNVFGLIDMNGLGYEEGVYEYLYDERLNHNDRQLRDSPAKVVEEAVDVDHDNRDGDACQPEQSQTQQRRHEHTPELVELRMEVREPEELRVEEPHDLEVDNSAERCDEARRASVAALLALPFLELRVGANEPAVEKPEDHIAEQKHTRSHHRNVEKEGGVLLIGEVDLDPDGACLEEGPDHDCVGEKERLMVEAPP